MTNYKNNKNIVVSILCETFNHVDYIEQCLESLINQETSFEYEILVHDDASTDGTDLIIKAYAEKYPDKIKPIIQTKNQYSTGDSIWYKFQIPRIRGEFVCICEGDDYWIDTEKIQKQADFLKKNQEYGLIYSKVKYYNQNSKTFTQLFGYEYSKYEDIYRFNNIPTLSIMMRKKLFVDFMEFVDENQYQKSWKMMDYPLWIWIYENSKIHFQDEITAVYRVLRESLSHSEDKLKRFAFIQSTCDIQLTLLKYYGYNQQFIDLIFFEYTINYLSYIRQIRLYSKLKELAAYFESKNYYWLSFYIRQYSYRYAPKFYLKLLRSINKRLLKKNLIKHPNSNNTAFTKQP